MIIYYVSNYDVCVGGARDSTVENDELWAVLTTVTSYLTVWNANTGAHRVWSEAPHSARDPPPAPHCARVHVCARAGVVSGAV